MCDSAHCESDRIVNIQGKTKSSCDYQYPKKGWDHDGYVPKDVGIGGGDYIEFNLCLECGKIQGEFPVSDDQVDEALGYPSCPSGDC